MIFVMVTNRLVIPEVDEEGRIKIKDRYPVFHLKDNVQLKQFVWATEFLADATVYEQYRYLIYEDKSIIDLWRPACLGAIIFFLTSTAGWTGLYIFAQRRYVEG